MWEKNLNTNNVYARLHLSNHRVTPQNSRFILRSSLPWSMSQAIQRVLSFSSKNSTPWEKQTCCNQVCFPGRLQSNGPDVAANCHDFWFCAGCKLEDCQSAIRVDGADDSPAGLPTEACTRWWRGEPSTLRPPPAPRWRAAETGRADGCQSPRSHSLGWRWCWGAPRGTRTEKGRGHIMHLGGMYIKRVTRYCFL